MAGILKRLAQKGPKNPLLLLKATGKAKKRANALDLSGHAQEVGFCQTIYRNKKLLKVFLDFFLVELNYF